MSDRTRKLIYAVAAPVSAIVFAMLVGALALMLAGKSPTLAYSAMGHYAQSVDSIVAIINRAAPYYVSALAVAIGFRMNLFNIGVNGQYLIAAILAGAAGSAIHLPGPLHVLVIILVAMLVGASWSGIAGVLKVTRNVNEVVATIMLNLISTSLGAWLLQTYLKDKNDPIIKTRKMDRSAYIPSLNRPLSWIGIDLKHTTTLNGYLLLAVAVGVAYHVVLNRSRFGFDLRVSGANPSAARASGIDPKRMVLFTMLISGALAGLVAIGPLISDPQFGRYVQDQFPARLGFTGIAVALVGRNHPSGMAISALLFAFVDRTTQILSLRKIPPEITLILQGTIILATVLAYEIVRRLGQAAEVKAAAERAEAEEHSPPGAGSGGPSPATVTA